MRRSDMGWVAFFLAVALGLAWVLPAPSSDTRELLSWGLNPSLSTPKQPPLMQWMGALVMRFAWPTTFWCVLLQQALNAVGLAYSYRLMRLWTQREPAALLTVLLSGSVYFLAAPVAFALNADILQFPFWAALTFHALRAFEMRKPWHFAAMAVAFALAFYAKYTVALLVAALGVASLYVPAYRGVWRDARLYLCAAAGLALVAPHLLAAPDSGAVGHATGTLHLSAGLGERLKNLRELGLGFLAYLAPGWIFLAAASLRGEARLRWSQAPAARSVRAAMAASAAALLVLVLGLGFRYPSRYDTPFLFLAWAAAASGIAFEPARLAASRAWVTRAAAGVAAAGLLGGLALYGGLTVHPRQQEPLVEAARRLQAQWPYACGPAYVMGDFGSAYGIGVSWSPPRPGAHLIELKGLPGYDPARRMREGAILIYRNRLDAHEIQAVLPDLDLSQPQRLTLPFAHTLNRAEITYEYLFVAPGGC